MVNLLNETREVLSVNGRSYKDVLWFGIGVYRCSSWDDFIRLADFNYDASFGTAVVHTDLIIVGVDWWLERHEYDGSEWWVYLTQPINHGEYLGVSSLIADDYDFYDDLNSDDNLNDDDD